MTHGARVRIVVTAAVIGALLAGVWLQPSGASVETKKTKTTWSAEDCAALQGISVDPKAGAGSFGKGAKATADAYNAAANKIKERKLKAALKALASFYVDLGGVGNAAEAAVLTAKGGKAYGRALKVFLNASVYCVSQITIPRVTTPTITVVIAPTTSTSSGSTSSTTSTSTSAPTTTSVPTTTTR